MINVWGDSVGAGIVQKLCQKRLDQADDTTTALSTADDSFKAPEMNGKRLPGLSNGMRSRSVGEPTGKLNEGYEAAEESSVRL